MTYLPNGDWFPVCTEKLVRRRRRRAGAPLTIFNVRNAQLCALYGAPLALISPDQHVAWRGASVEDADCIIATLCGARTFDAGPNEKNGRTA
jgi:hypothetical protein